jgi:hypothetical protein
MSVRDRTNSNKAMGSACIFGLSHASGPVSVPESLPPDLVAHLPAVDIAAAQNMEANTEAPMSLIENLQIGNFRLHKSQRCCYTKAI